MAPVSQPASQTAAPQTVASTSQQNMYHQNMYQSNTIQPNMQQPNMGQQNMYHPSVPGFRPFIGIGLHSLPSAPELLRQRRYLPLTVPQYFYPHSSIPPPPPPQANTIQTGNNAQTLALANQQLPHLGVGTGTHGSSTNAPTSNTQATNTPMITTPPPALINQQPQMGMGVGTAGFLTTPPTLNNQNNTAQNRTALPSIFANQRLPEWDPIRGISGLRADTTNFNYPIHNMSTSAARSSTVHHSRNDSAANSAVARNSPSQHPTSVSGPAVNAPGINTPRSNINYAGGSGGTANTAILSTPLNNSPIQNNTVSQHHNGHGGPGQPSQPPTMGQPRNVGMGNTSITNGTGLITPNASPTKQAATTSSGPGMFSSPHNTAANGTPQNGTSSSSRQANGSGVGTVRPLSDEQVQAVMDHLGFTRDISPSNASSKRKRKAKHDEEPLDSSDLPQLKRAKVNLGPPKKTVGVASTVHFNAGHLYLNPRPQDFAILAASTSATRVVTLPLQDPVEGIVPKPVKKRATKKKTAAPSPANMRAANTMSFAPALTNVGAANTMAFNPSSVGLGTANTVTFDPISVNLRSTNTMTFDPAPVIPTPSNSSPIASSPANGDSLNFSPFNANLPSNGAGLSLDNMSSVAVPPGGHIPLISTDEEWDAWLNEHNMTDPFLNSDTTAPLNNSDLDAFFDQMGAEYQSQGNPAVASTDTSSPNALSFNQMETELPSQDNTAVASLGAGDLNIYFNQTETEQQTQPNSAVAPLDVVPVGEMAGGNNFPMVNSEPGDTFTQEVDAFIAEMSLVIEGADQTPASEHQPQTTEQKEAWARNAMAFMQSGFGGGLSLTDLVGSGPPDVTPTPESQPAASPATDGASPAMTEAASLSTDTADNGDEKDDWTHNWLPFDLQAEVDALFGETPDLASASATSVLDLSGATASTGHDHAALAAAGMERAGMDETEHSDASDVAADVAGAATAEWGMETWADFQLEFANAFALYGAGAEEDE